MLDDIQIAYKAVVKIFDTYELTLPTLETYRNELDSENIMKFYYDHGIPQTVTLDDLNLIYRPVIATHINEARLFSHVDLVLDQCKRLGIKTAIVSATGQETLEKQAKQFGVYDKFDSLRGGAWKKEPVLRALIEEYKVQPSEVIYVDDTCDCIEAAKRVGLFTIGFMRGYNSWERLRSADELVDSFFYIMEIIDHGGEE